MFACRTQIIMLKQTEVQHEYKFTLNVIRFERRVDGRSLDELGEII